MATGVADVTLKGIIAAPATPFTADGELKLDAFEAYADHMVLTGITGLFVNGTLGEGLSMTVGERKAAAERWLQVASGRFDTVIVHVGAGCLKDASELAAHAESIKAPAIAALAPAFFKPESIETLVEYMRQVAAAAPHTPFFYYDINILTGLFFDLGKLINLCKQKIPTFRGVKYSCREMANYEIGSSQCENGKYQIAIGAVDEEFLPWLALGATVTICTSFMGKVHAGTRRAFDAGKLDEARNQQRLAQHIGYVKRKYGADVAVSKAILRLLGVDVGPVRLPLTDVTPEQQASLAAELQAVGFFDVVL